MRNVHPKKGIAFFLLASTAVWGALTACQGFSGDEEVTDMSDGSTNTPIDGSTTTDDASTTADGDVIITNDSGVPSDSGSGPFYVSPVDDAGCPTGRGPKMVISDGRCVDESEVTETEFDVGAAADLNSVPRSGYCETSKSARPANKRDYPVTNVSWCDAFAFCTWAGKRLCTDVDKSSAVCFEHPVQPYTDCNLAKNKGPQPVKTHCKSTAGVYDAVGNVQEFVDVGKPTLTDIATWSGGNSYTTAYGPNICTDPYTVYLPFDGHVNSKDPNLGFRCCADPKKN